MLNKTNRIRFSFTIVGRQSRDAEDKHLVNDWTVELNQSLINNHLFLWLSPCLPLAWSPFRLDVFIPLACALSLTPFLWSAPRMCLVRRVASFVVIWTGRREAVVTANLWTLARVTTDNVPFSLIIWVMFVRLLITDHANKVVRYRGLFVELGKTEAVHFSDLQSPKSRWTQKFQSLSFLFLLIFLHIFLFRLLSFSCHFFGW